MKRVSDLEYLKLSKGQKFVYKLKSFFAGIPVALKNGLTAIGRFFRNAGKTIGDEIADIGSTFKNGDWKTRLSFFIMGFGSLARGQILRGILFLLFELVFIGYMILPQGGGYWMSMLPSLGKVGPGETYDPILDTYVYQYNDNSFRILLYGVLTIFFIIAFIYTWRVNVRQNKVAEQILRSGKKLKSGKDDLRSLVDDQFHKTLLALPMTGILIFTVMPIVFMILVAFTNYDGSHDGYINNLFTWVGLENFNTMLSWTGGGGHSYAATFGEILAWTLIWAFFATFTNYFLGMLVAMMINKKGIRVKKLWRTILVMTIAIPQFISLLYVSKMFAKNGIVNGLLLDLGWINQAIDFCHRHQHLDRYPVPDADRDGHSDEYPGGSVRIGKDRRRIRLEAVYKDHAAVYAFCNRPVSSDAVYLQHEQLQRHLPSDRRCADQCRGILGVRLGRLYRPSDHMAVQDHNRPGRAVLSCVCHRHPRVRCRRGDLADRLQRAAQYQE